MAIIRGSDDVQYYALGDREIWFETDATGEIQIVGIEKVDLPSDEDTNFGMSINYPMVYVFKILSLGLPYPLSEHYEKKYKDEIDRVVKEKNKHKTSGVAYLMEI